VLEDVQIDATQADAKAGRVERRIQFDTWYVDTYRPMLHLAVLLLHDEGRANDVVQDSFAEAYRRWDRLSGYDRPDLWMRRVVLNRCVSRLRRRSAEERAVARWAGRAGDRAIVDEISDDSGIWRLVQQLPRRQVQALALVYGTDLSVDDAAAVMGCSAGSVKTHLSRGRAALAARLEEAR
jgi:RNA polymerase sigma-70 factor (ECF subfamily)